METTINERINSLVDFFERGIKSAFARQIGTSQQAIQNLLVGRQSSKPSYDLISGIIQRYPEVSAEWLLTGQGEMLRAGRQLTLAPADTEKPAATEPALAGLGSQLIDLLKAQVKEQQAQIEYLREQLSRAIGQTESLLRLVGAQREQPIQEGK